MKFFIEQWNLKSAIPNNIAPVNFDDIEFLKPWGRFVYAHDKTTRYIDAENFCVNTGLTIEQHLERISTEAVKNKYSVHYLEDIDMDNLPPNQVEVLLTLFDEKNLMKIPPHIRQTPDGRVDRSLVFGKSP